jgi:tyrosyl-tRNA synthetase
MDAKRDLVKEVAKYQTQLFRHKFSAIGNIFVASSPEPEPKKEPASQGTEEVNGDAKPSDSQPIVEEEFNEQSSNLKVQTDSPGAANAENQSNSKDSSNNAIAANTEAASREDSRHYLSWVGWYH